MIERAIEIVMNRRMTADTYLMGLRSPEMVGEARAGQFVMIQTRPGSEPLLRRPFSICGTQEDLFLILYRVVGQGTRIMADQGEGQTLSVLGPLGKGFELPANREKCLLVGGGLGVAPLFFLAQTMKTASIEFMMGFGTAGDILKTTQIDGPNINVAIATDDGSYGHAGPATDLLEVYVEARKHETGGMRVYTCGPKPMMKKVAAMAGRLSISCQASLETAMGCGMGACLGCAVKAAPGEGPPYRYVCKDGPVFPVQAIDWDGL